MHDIGQGIVIGLCTGLLLIATSCCFSDRQETAADWIDKKGLCLMMNPTTESSRSTKKDVVKTFSVMKPGSLETAFAV